jgi:hypothetical protein
MLTFDYPTITAKKHLFPAAVTMHRTFPDKVSDTFTYAFEDYNPAVDYDYELIGEQAKFMAMCPGVVVIELRYTDEKKPIKRIRIKGEKFR